MKKMKMTKSHKNELKLLTDGHFWYIVLFEIND